MSLELFTINKSPKRNCSSGNKQFLKIKRDPAAVKPAGFFFDGRKLNGIFIGLIRGPIANFYNLPARILLFGLLLLLCSALPLSAQSFLNGGFETNTASACDYNMSNATWNTKMANSMAYGSGQELDIMSTTCPYGTPQSGSWFVALASPSGLTDAFTMTLSAPLTAGATYTIHFYDKGDPTYPPALPIMIGLSTVAGAVGTNIYTGPTPTLGVWNMRSFSFVAPNNGQYISVQTTGPTRWSHVDNFYFDVPLPIEIININGTTSQLGNTISWQTENESNNDFFTIVRSKDGINWEDIGMVDGAGNSSSLLNYSFFDDDQYMGTAYYRIRQTDFDGQSTYSAIIALEGSQSIDVYPNPADDLINIRFKKSVEQKITVQVFSGIGEIVQSTNLSMSENTDEIQIDISSLKRGVYYLCVKGDLQYEAKQFIVQ